MFLRLFLKRRKIKILRTTTVSGIGSKKTKYELIHEVCNEPDPLTFADLSPLLFERCEVGEFVGNVETLKSEFSKYRYLFVALVFDTASSVIRITVRSRI